MSGSFLFSSIPAFLLRPEHAQTPDPWVRRDLCRRSNVSLIKLLGPEVEVSTMFWTTLDQGRLLWAGGFVGSAVWDAFADASMHSFQRKAGRAERQVCRYFEAERLVRKVLLATAAAALPTATYPDVQMTVLTVITGTSLLLYGIYQPYHEPEWNWSELALLVTALMLISIASTVISNEIHWDKTEFGQKTMIVGLGATVSIVCCGIMMKIGLEVWRERRSKAAPD
ncbi:unnamed protein product [Durusdinium trenchii]|uniref:Uncharacterized protein n=1 Tax=Durusdinium trenchii TaxID=1381693 RepID=A0ABP0KHG9_9DINO